MINILARATDSIIGKVFGSKEKRQDYKQKNTEFKQKLQLKSIDYAESKTPRWLYVLCISPIVKCYLILLYSPELSLIPYIKFKNLVESNLKVINIIGVDNIFYIIFVGVLGITTYKIKKANDIGKLATELYKSNKMEEIDRGLNYDYDLIEKHEQNLTKAYVPKDPDKQNSGVTIGMGLDLNYQTPKTLKKAGVSDAVIKKVSAYLGLEGKDAIKKLKEQPLILTQHDTTQLNNAVFNFYKNKVREEFHHTLYTYPRNAQTVALAVSWHNGWDLSRTCPRFLKFMVERNWKKVSKELREFFPINKGTGKRPFARRYEEYARLIDAIPTK